jgi:Zn ribbon nucleic-acid-binding protein
MHFVPLRTFDNYIEANIVLGMLMAANINCHLKDENTVTIDPLLSPALGGIKLMVYYQQIERAWELLEEAEKQYLKNIACPICKTHNLKIMLLSGKSVEIVKLYQCANCGYDFKELPAQ